MPRSGQDYGDKSMVSPASPAGLVLRSRHLVRKSNADEMRVTNSRIHLKWNSGFDPSFGVLRRSDLRLAIIRTLSDGRDVTQLGPEVFSGTSISQGAQYLGMDTVNSPSQVGHELMC